MTQILQPYELGLPSADLQFSEVVGDVIYSLQQLSVTVDDVFGRVERRLNDEKNRLSSVNTRVNVCQQKVQLVKGSNRATTVFSTAKFPGPKELHMYNSLFSQTKEVPLSQAVMTCFHSFILCRCLLLHVLQRMKSIIS